MTDYRVEIRNVSELVVKVVVDVNKKVVGKIVRLRRD